MPKNVRVRPHAGQGFFGRLPVCGIDSPHGVWSAMNRIRAGMDSGKAHHRCLVLDESGEITA